MLWQSKIRIWTPLKLEARKRYLRPWRSGGGMKSYGAKRGEGSESIDGNRSSKRSEKNTRK